MTKPTLNRLTACFLSCLLISFFTLNGAQRCDLASPHIPGTQYKDTLDVAALNGKTVDVPLSVTRISRDAFAFLKGNSTVDIVYVLDHSLSMKVDGYWESSDRQTVRYIREVDGLIRSGKFTDCGRHQVPYGGGFSKIELKKICGAFDPILDTLISGDPFGSSSYAIREAIGEQARLAPVSRAAYLPFDTDDMQYARQTLVSLDSTSHVNMLFDKIDLARNDFVSSSNYVKPLELARSWLQSSDNPVIFFITDLHPNETGLSELTSYLANYPIPVYGVFVGIEDPNPTIKDLFLKTGSGKGDFYRISPEHSDSLKYILKQFVGNILAWKPSAGLVENTTTGARAVATGESYVAQQGLSLMVTDSVVALREGANTVHVRAEFSSSDGKKEVKEATFTVNVGGVSDALFDEQKAKLGIWCGPVSSLAITDTQFAPVAVIEDASSFGVRFSTGASYERISTPVAFLTTGDRESETIQLTLSGTALSGQEMLPLQIGTQAAQNDGTVQADLSDQLIARWRHERDPRDTAYASVIVSQMKTAVVARAVYKDGRGDSADGCIDTISLFLDAASVLRSGVDVSLIAQYKHLISFGGELSGLVITEVLRYGDTQVNLVIASNGVLAHGNQTMSIGPLPVKADGFLAWPSSGVLADGVAPVAVGTALYARSIEEGIPDTLTVTFSEPVSIVSGTPFQVQHGNERYGFELTQLREQGATLTFLVSKLYPQAGTSPRLDQLPGSGDLLSILQAQVTEHGGGNPQLYSVNRRVPVRVSGAFAWFPVAVPNPFVPGNMVSAGALGTGTGTAILVVPKSRLSNLGDISGEITIYDAVGNVVQSRLRLVNDIGGSTGSIYAWWDGRNRNGRVAGSGTYTAFVRLRDPQGKLEQKRVKIGVAR